MSHSSWQQQQQHLDSLQGMVNAVLIETGKALRSANAKGAKTIGHNHGRLKAFLPTALDKFHLALDELETDIVRAQAVMSRDLRDLRAKQYEIDNPSTRLAEETTVPQDAIARPETVSHVAEGAREMPLEDLPTDNSQKVAQDDNTATGSPIPKIEALVDEMFFETESGKATQLQASPQKDIDQNKAPAFSITDDDSKKMLESSQQDESMGLEIVVVDKFPSASSEVPATAGLQSTSFDSIFDIGNAGDTDLNFDDFDFNTGQDNHDFNQNDGGMDLSSFGNQESSSKNDDVGTLLQGLESYGDVNGGGDFDALDTSNNPVNDEPSADQGGISATDDFAMGAGDLDMAMGMGNNESTFVDLLEGMNMEFGDDGTGGDILEHGEFDDAFFELNADV